MALLDHGRFHSTTHKLSFVILALVFYGTIVVPCFPQAAPDREYQIKAAFLYNFVQFVKWPGKTFSSPEARFYIGVLGDDPFGSALDNTVAGETANGHPFSIMRSERVEDLEACQMIFISRSEGNKIDLILSALKTKPILTVSELEGFASKGGDINFYISGNKVRFEINPQVAEGSGIKISSQLLSLGKIVRP